MTLHPREIVATWRRLTGNGEGHPETTLEAMRLVAEWVDLEASRTAQAPTPTPPPAPPEPFPADDPFLPATNSNNRKRGAVGPGGPWGGAALVVLVLALLAALAALGAA